VDPNLPLSLRFLVMYTVRGVQKVSQCTSVKYKYKVILFEDRMTHNCIDIYIIFAMLFYSVVKYILFAFVVLA